MIFYKLTLRRPIWAGDWPRGQSFICPGWDCLTVYAQPFFADMRVDLFNLEPVL